MGGAVSLLIRLRFRTIPLILSCEPSIAWAASIKRLRGEIRERLGVVIYIAVTIPNLSQPAIH
jgi:hypothetical protein